MATPRDPDRPDPPDRGVDRRTLRRRAPLHPLMEAWLDAVASKGRPHLRANSARLRPLLHWCREQRIDPPSATASDLGRFRAWLWDIWRSPTGQPEAYHTKRQTLGMTRAWYRWLVQDGRIAEDPAHAVLALRGGAKPAARFAHHPLHPLMAAYLEHHRLRGRPTTAATAHLVLGQFAAWCTQQGIDPLQLTRTQAEDYLVWISSTARTPAGRPLARQTVAMRIAYLRSWYEWLEVRREIVANPAAKLQVRCVTSRVVVREHLELQEAIALVETQAQAVVDAKPATITWARHLRLLAAVCLGLATGRRIGGLLVMRVEDLDLARNELRVEREKGRTGRVLPVAEWAVAVIRSYLRDARPLLALDAKLPWLFVGSGDGGRMRRCVLTDGLETLFRQTVAANPDLTDLPGKTITWHSLRVSFATMLFSNGCPIRSVNELMLHRCLSTTARYTPIPIEDMHQIWTTAHPRP